MKTIKIRDFSELPTYFTGIAEYSNGQKEWFLNGKLHREDGPAVEWADGTKGWYLNGQWHRVDGPAYEDADGTKYWYLNGQLHRVDGPARECADGEKVWYLNGQLHRVDGPAWEGADGSKQWYLNGRYIYALEPIGEYLLIEEGLSSEFEWLGQRVTQRKVLTGKGFMYIPNLPGI